MRISGVCGWLLAFLAVTGCVSKGDTIIGDDAREKPAPEAEADDVSGQAGEASGGEGTAAEVAESSEGTTAESEPNGSGGTPSESAAVGTDEEAAEQESGEEQGPPQVSGSRPSATFEEGVSYALSSDGLMSQMPTRIEVGDADGESGLDIVVPFDDGLDVFLNDGDGGFGNPVTKSGLFRPIQPMFGDFNGDGLSDIFVLQNGETSLLRALQPGLYADPEPGVDTTAYTNGTPIGGCAVNLDGDDYSDAVVWSIGLRTVTVLHGVSVGAPSPGAEIMTANEPATGGGFIGHLNDDDVLDAAYVMRPFASQPRPGTLGVVLGAEGGAFAGEVEEVPVGTVAWAVAGADLDGDGDTDLVVTNEQEGTLFVFQNDGDGAFENILTLETDQKPHCVAAGHFDDDEHMDLIVHAFGMEYTGLPHAQIFFGGGGGAFHPPVRVDLEQPALCVTAADIDADGDDDIISLGYGELRTFVNDR